MFLCLIGHIWSKRERTDVENVLHPQYVFELVAMQQDWERVGVGGWEDRDQFSERKEVRQEGKRGGGSLSAN